MKTTEKIIQLGKELPLGAKKLISKETGITEKTVANILKGKPARMDNVLKVVKSAKNIIERYNKEIV